MIPQYNVPPSYMAKRRRSRVVRRPTKPKSGGLLCQSAIECAHSAWSHIKSAEQAGATPANQAQMLFAFGAEVFAQFFPERMWPVRVVRRGISQSDVDAALNILVRDHLDFGVSQWAGAVGLVSQPLDVASAVATDERIDGTTLDKNITKALERAVAEQDSAERMTMYQRIKDRYDAVMSGSLKYAPIMALVSGALVACLYAWGGLCFLAQRTIADYINRISDYTGYLWDKYRTYDAMGMCGVGDIENVRPVGPSITDPGAFVPLQCSLFPGPGNMYQVDT